METRRAAAVVLLAAIAAAGTFVASHTRLRSVVDRSWGLGPHLSAVTADSGVAAAPAAHESVELVRMASGKPAAPAVAVRDGAAQLSSGCPRDVGARFHLLLFTSQCRAQWHLGVRRSAPLSIDVPVGDIRLTGLAGPLHARTGVGGIVGARLRSSTATLDTQVGDVRLVFAAPPSRVTAHAAVGDVDVVLPPGAYALRLHAALGAVHVGSGIRELGSSTRTIDLSAQVGNVRVLAGA